MTPCVSNDVLDEEAVLVALIVDEFTSVRLIVPPALRSEWVQWCGEALDEAQGCPA